MAPKRKNINRGPGFICVFCQKYFMPSTSEVIHIRRHIQEKPYPCSYCNNSYTCITDQYLHQKKMHNELFLCALCDLNCSGINSLKVHYFKCHPDFMRTFDLPENREKDPSQEEKATEEIRPKMKEKLNVYKPVECEVCGKMFRKRANLRKHQRWVNCGESKEDYGYQRRFEGRGSKSRNGAIKEAVAAAPSEN